MYKHGLQAVRAQVDESTAFSGDSNAVYLRRAESNPIGIWISDSRLCRRLRARTWWDLAGPQFEEIGSGSWGRKMRCAYYGTWPVPDHLPLPSSYLFLVKEKEKKIIETKKTRPDLVCLHVPMRFF